MKPRGSKPRLITFIGTRPEIIKLSSLMPLLDERFEHYLVHSGQHYSAALDRNFFKELELRQPDFNLRVGSGEASQQIGMMVEKLGGLLLKLQPQGVIVQGDTNTSLAGALAAALHRGAGMKLFHVEGLLRSYNLLQPEEFNRRMVDQMSDCIFSVNAKDIVNAKAEGIPARRVVCTGNTLADVCLRMAAKVDVSRSLRKFSLESGSFALATLHRAENVDSKEILTSVMKALNELAREVPIVLPAHPRTRVRLKQFGLERGIAPELSIIDPVGYRDTIALLKGARFCLTDSGGLLEEAAILKTPALIVRNEVEQVAFVQAGIHELVRPGYKSVLAAARRLARSDAELERRRKARFKIPTGVSARIVKELVKRLQVP